MKGDNVLPLLDLFSSLWSFNAEAAAEADTAAAATDDKCEAPGPPASELVNAKSPAAVLGGIGGWRPAAIAAAAACGIIGMGGPWAWGGNCCACICCYSNIQTFNSNIDLSQIYMNTRNALSIKYRILKSQP